MGSLNVAVLGGGSWGTTVASMITRNAPVKLWARNSQIVDEINTQHTNSTYLPGASLPEKLAATSEMRNGVATEVPTITRLALCQRVQRPAVQVDAQAREIAARECGVVAPVIDRAA